MFKVKDTRQSVPLGTLKTERANAVAAAKAILDAAGSRDLNPTEQADFNRHKEVAAERQFQIEVCERSDSATWDPNALQPRLTIDPNPSADGFSNEPNARSGWQTVDGQNVPVLTSKQKMTSLNKRRPKISAGKLLLGMLTGRWDGGIDNVSAALGEGTNSAGGYLVNDEVANEIIDLARAKSVVIQAGARTVPMNSDTLRIVKVTADPSVSLTAENAALSQSQPTFGALQFTASKIACLAKCSRELLMDAPNAGEAIMGVLTAAMAAELDRLALVGTPPGIVGLSIQDDVNTQPAVGSPDYDDFLDAIKAVEAANGNPTAAIFSPKTKQSLAKLKEATTNAYLQPPPDYTALQRLVTTSVTDALAFVGDFSQMYVAVRQAILIESSREAGFSNDQIWIRATWRGDVGLAHADHFTVLSGIS